MALIFNIKKEPSILFWLVSFFGVFILAELDDYPYVVFISGVTQFHLNIIVQSLAYFGLKIFVLKTKIKLSGRHTKTPLVEEKLVRRPDKVQLTSVDLEIVNFSRRHIEHTLIFCYNKTTWIEWESRAFFQKIKKSSVWHVSY